MGIDLDILFNTKEDSIDMKAGLDTMQGTSDAVRKISETILTENIPQKNTHKRDVRTNLKKSFKGSYGQIFSVEVYNERLKKRLRKIGKPVFCELVSYFLLESVFEESQPLTEKANEIIEELGDKSDELIKIIRSSCLKDIHQMPKKFGHEVDIRFRFSRADIKNVARFDRETAKTLETIESDVPQDIEASISRFNIKTGNGRLKFPGVTKTVAFGFITDYYTLEFKAKKTFSENLNRNNGLNDEHWETLRLRARPVTLQDGTVVKYLVMGFL